MTDICEGGNEAPGSVKPFVKNTKKILNTKPEGRRNIGRQKLRWLDGVEEDLRTLGVRRWRQKALVGQEWTKILREAKARLQGP
ncbi:hypothetical protein ANN_23455 [Periplaneta americana]|uniref:Uncharacterized protein n=1 Tax=Periplaneta americana TaxID=6978 RepID=A0ABQ8SM23_PERAM|nr:hypothetical protein ANN_23455 [Periplaneta americana]